MARLPSGVLPVIVKEVLRGKRVAVCVVNGARLHVPTSMLVWREADHAPA